MLDKRNINSVCLLRKDLLSDKVSTKKVPDFEHPTSPFTLPPPTCSPFQFTCARMMRVHVHIVCSPIQTYEKNNQLLKSHLNKVH